MSEQSAFDRLIEQAAVNAAEQRDDAITESARLAESAEARIVERVGRTGSFEWQLSDEVNALSERMEWLVDHPKLSRFVGKSGIQLSLQRQERDNRRGEAVRTPIILEFEKTVEAAHILTAGYVLWKYHHASPPFSELYIDRAVTDATTGREDRSQAYRLYPFKSEVGPRVEVSGGDFDDFRTARTRELIAQYAKEHEWMDAFEISDGVWRAGSWNRSIRCNRERLNARIQDPKMKVFSGLIKDGHEEEITEKLFPQLERGAGWDYPDVMFAEPLDLVRAAHDAIGRRK